MVGNNIWDSEDMTFGQAEDRRRARTTYAEIKEEDWPCNTQLCPNCYIWMPAGYTVCISCHCPFIFEAINSDEPMCVRGPSAAPAMVVPGARGETQPLVAGVDPN
eukprot:13847089-Heterocapsa_arctica.AAC.1